MTLVLPGRFRDAELATESIHSSVQLLSLYHDLLLFRATLSPSSPPKPPATLSRGLHARYTRFWAAKSRLYRRVAVVLQVVQYTELLIEMWAKRRGEAVRWRAVVLIEAVKAFCRLLLLRITRSRPLVAPALPDRDKVVEPDEDEEEDGKALAEMMGEDKSPGQRHAGEKGSADGSSNGKAINGNGQKPRQLPPADPRKEWSMPRTGLTLPSLPSRGDISSYLQARVLTADDIKPATRLLPALRGSAHAAEVLYILAPLVYAAALSRSSSSPGSKLRTAWAPWLAGLSVQLAARQLARRARGQEGGGRGATALEREEWARRGRQMWWWLMRGAAYEHVTKAVVGGVRRRVPGFVGTILEDYEYLWENYYFSTSDS